MYSAIGSADEVMKTTTTNIKPGKLAGKGFKYFEPMDFSCQGVDANSAAREILHMSLTHSIAVDMVIGLVTGDTVNIRNLIPLTNIEITGAIINNKKTDTEELQSFKTNQMWRTNINYTQDYRLIDEKLYKIFVCKDDVCIFKEFIINVIEKRDNKYGVLILPGTQCGNFILSILRSLGNLYNRYDNPRNNEETLIRHDDDSDYAINLIKKYPMHHHVYLWCKNIEFIKSKYEYNNIMYTTFKLNNIDIGCPDFVNINTLYSMLNDYLIENYICHNKKC
jgi:hypothetical protein